VPFAFSKFESVLLQLFRNRRARFSSLFTPAAERLDFYAESGKTIFIGVAVVRSVAAGQQFSEFNLYRAA